MAGTLTVCTMVVYIPAIILTEGDVKCCHRFWLATTQNRLKFTSYQLHNNSTTVNIGIGEKGNASKKGLESTPLTERTTVTISFRFLILLLTVKLLVLYVSSVAFAFPTIFSLKIN